MGTHRITNESPQELNAKLNLWAYDENGKKFIDFASDKEAARQYHLQEVNPRTNFFHSLKEKLEFLFANDYYEPEVWTQYGVTLTGNGSIVEDEYFEDIKNLYKFIYDKKHRFPTYLSALKFYTQYAMKSFDGKVLQERYEDRVVATALLLARGQLDQAKNITEEIVEGRLQPATPTFSNAGKKQRGELISCFLTRIEDNFESISKAVATSLQLSKRGGGVALSLTNIREAGAPIKKVENMSSGVVPVMKILEDSFSYADQLGTRSGAGAVYLSIHHPDILRFLDTKKENSDEKTRIKTLSLGIVVTDILFQAASNNEDLYLFSPYSIMQEYGKAMSDISITEMYDELIENPRIRKTKTNARKLLQKIAEIQFESGYPYFLFEDTVNKANAISGRVSMSNLCSEILQVSDPATFDNEGHYDHEGRDISCNLASMNVDNVMRSGSLGQTVETAIRALTSVSDLSNIEIVPSVRRGNELSHSVGLGQMSLHSFFVRQGWKYGSQESLDFTNAYFMAVAYHSYRASNLIAKERGETFHEFEKSKYADPAYLTKKYSRLENINIPADTISLFFDAGIVLPTQEDWASLAVDIANHGLYSAYLQAVPPTGSISYINYSSASIHPMTDPVETRKEGLVGRVYFPQPNVTSENFDQVENAYDVGYKKVIDVYAEATKHVDQGLSLTLFFPDTATTRDVNKAQIYAWKKGIKTLYYIRLKKSTLSGTEMAECVSCQL